MPASQQRVWRPLTVDEVREALRRQKGKAAGADHWSVSGVAELPDGVINFVSDCYALCVRVGKSPKAWKSARQIHLPKEGLKGRDPAPVDPAPVEKLRPIIVLSSSIWSQRVSSTQACRMVWPMLWLACGASSNG